MNLLEILISSLAGSLILMSLTQSSHQLYASLDQQGAKAILQSEALQALQMIGGIHPNSQHPQRIEDSTINDQRQRIDEQYSSWSISD